eukprot:TRINITY_DN6122_c0_g1_i1.p1 TRINITY_DN6122_c0_g1~~TRINITY_DN6122_c0_g1_i1.p1  ORF type:complete len:459 (-),score=113.28 TRINITY_DN6122_c0_g1_i1:41-1417(-)
MDNTSPYPLPSLPLPGLYKDETLPFPDVKKPYANETPPTLEPQKFQASPTTKPYASDFLSSEALPSGNPVSPNSKLVNVSEGNTAAHAHLESFFPSFTAEQYPSQNQQDPWLAEAMKPTERFNVFDQQPAAQPTLPREQGSRVQPGYVAPPNNNNIQRSGGGASDNIDPTVVRNIQTQFDKIMKFMDHMDIRLNRLETSVRDIIANQKASNDQSKNYRQTIISQIDQLKQIQQQQARVLSSFPSTVPKSTPNLSSSDSKPPVTDADLELARKLQAKFDNESEREIRPKSKSASHKSNYYPTLYATTSASDNNDLELAKQLQAQFDAEMIISNSTIGPTSEPKKSEDEKKQAGFFSRLFVKNPGMTPKEPEKEIAEEKKQPAKKPATATFGQGAKQTTSNKSNMTPNNPTVYQQQPISGTPYPYFVPPMVYQPQVPMQAMAPFPTTQPYQPPLYYMPPQ